ncbi:Hypothetical protein R9X50_00549500 [Acrodontium crateriforme]|uniref:F-box domain-containing protein n=1 Tax=Acrodontium crateriforme TaxID=150365 RepID=A0AAQ3M823_9PEZI|nr:Hypothetical protein R9X50_00549500 [Acrodontium crateriforme]
MHINDLPAELLNHILFLATKANSEEGESFTYGLSQAPLPLEKAKLTKYIRGPLSAESLRWDATASIRQTCGRWHDWALSYNLEHIFERCWKGSERWAELTLDRSRYKYYELIPTPSGYAVYRDPYGSLKHTDRLFKTVPSTSTNVRRLWFNGFYTAETDKLILSVIANCDRIQTLSVPWTILRRGTADDWVDLLNVNTGHGTPLESLELQATGLSREQAAALENDDSPCPLDFAKVDFSALKRLKIFGNTMHKPICDSDLRAIARTATNLKCLDITNLSTVSVAGMLALVKASHDTLQVLEHSPRSDDGFYHPYPGNLETGEHICELLASLPEMRDLSISVPNMCGALFANHEVKWVGECQVRTTDLCSCKTSTSATIRAEKLREAFDSARDLIRARRRMEHHLSIEIFFAGCIFEPAKKLVHGDFALAEISSNGRWPMHKQSSTKGPYGASGVYEKEEGYWDVVSEEDYLYAVDRNWIAL